MFTPPVVAKRTSRYRGSVAPEDGTGVGQDDRTGVESKGYSSGGGVLSFHRGKAYRLTMANSQEEA